MFISGWILINKPIGITSTKCLSLLKQFIPKNIKIGHCGTLDPFASGLLIIGIGETTKLIDYIMTDSKAYEFQICWGLETDTLDKDGVIIKQTKNIPKIEEIKNVLKEFIGPIKQIPPHYSAIKINGKRSYDIIRNIKTKLKQEDYTKIIEQNEIKARNVECYSLYIEKQKNSLNDINDVIYFLSCSKGFYVRALARDIAHKLNSLCYVHSLKRVKIGSFELKETIELKWLIETLKKSEVDIKDFILPTETIFRNNKINIYNSNIEESIKLYDGQKIKIIENQKIINKNDSDEIFLFFKNKIIGIGNLDNSFILPKKIFPNTIKSFNIL